MDFGMVGTAEIISPEQVRGEKASPAVILHDRPVAELVAFDYAWP